MKRLTLVLFLLLAVSFQVEAQSKKKLRLEIRKLTLKLENLHRQQDNLLEAYKKLEKMYLGTKDQKEEMALELNVAKASLDETLARYNEIMAQYEAILKIQELEDSQILEPSTSTSLASRSDDLCSSMEGELRTNQSYSQRFQPLEGKAFGVQLSAFSSLCEAYEEASQVNSFTNNEVTVFIRPKKVNGRKFFAVIQGAWTTRNSARAFLEDQIYSNDAFIVSH